MWPGNDDNNNNPEYIWKSVESNQICIVKDDSLHLGDLSVNLSKAPSFLWEWRLKKTTRQCWVKKFKKQQQASKTTDRTSQIVDFMLIWYRTSSVEISFNCTDKNHQWLFASSLNEQVKEFLPYLERVFGVSLSKLIYHTIYSPPPSTTTNSPPSSLSPSLYPSMYFHFPVDYCVAYAILFMISVEKTLPEADV